MSIFSQIIQYAMSGITSGSVYAIIGICWSIVFIVTRILNFTTGEFVMLGGMLTWVFSTLGLGTPLSAILAIISTVMIGILLETLAIRPVRYPTETTNMMVTIASASIITGIILVTCGSEAHLIKPLISSESISFLGANITSQTILVVGVLIVLTILLSSFFNFTLFGKALRATAINPDAARLVGIRIRRVSTFCFGLVGGLGALAGILITPITFTGYGEGLMSGLKGLVATMLGGWNITGTVLSGLMLGLLEGFFAGFVSPGWKDAFVFLMMVFFLIYRTIKFPSKRKKSE